MKKLLCLLLVLAMVLCGCTTPTPPPAEDTVCEKHTDTDSNGVCDTCHDSVYVYFNIYSINDLHGKMLDGDNHPGVDELTTYLRNAQQTQDNVIILSAGDMWQGSAESNSTNGFVVTEWMNELDFVSMTIGNHEFDWGEDPIRENLELAEFPFLAINIYDRDTDTLADYCTPSVMVERGGLQVGIIGAIGDCYSSISSDKTENVYFKTGSQLTALVKAESERLRSEGADLIIYSLHDGYGSTENTLTSVSSSKISSYYDTALSDGYVDLVFEGHTHQGYRLVDDYGVYHLQNRGDNKGGISYVQLALNTANDTSSVRVAQLVTHGKYQLLEDDPIVEELVEKYEDQIGDATRPLGYNSQYRNSTFLANLVAELYYEAGVEKWGDEYDIVLGGGSLNIRSPGSLQAGDVTYAPLMTILPFDNRLSLCAVQGKYLWSRFLNNDSYSVGCGENGPLQYEDIDMDATYYIITDSWSAYYSPNHLTVVEEYDDGVYARDLLADYIEANGLA